MSVPALPLHHPINGSSEPTWSGWSWPAFFFGVIWLAVKGLWGHFIVNLLILFATAGFAAPIIWLVYGAIGNDAHRKSLVRKGYLEQDPRHVTPAQTATRTGVPNELKDPLERIRAMADRRDRGALTEEEFQAQKTKILASSER